MTMKQRMMDGIPFILFKEYVNKITAKSAAKTLRDRGYYVRVIRTSRNYEIWVSKNPRWFYKLAKF